MDYQDKPTKYWANRSRLSAFVAAKDGFVSLWAQEMNFRIHLMISLVVLIAGLVFQITVTEWLVLLLLITIVLSLEMVNSAIETVVDMVVGTQWHQLAKRSKDIAAAAVFLAAGTSIIVGLIIFVPYLLAMLK